MRRLTTTLSALAMLAAGQAYGADALGSITERVYLPPGSVDRARIAPPASKAAPNLVTEGELLSRLERELTKQCNADGELRLSFGRPWQAMRISSENWEVALPDPPAGGLAKSFLLRVRISVGGRPAFDQQMVVQAQLWKPVLVATRRLQRGQALDATAAEVQTLDVLRDRIAPIAASTRLDEWEVLQTVVEGRPLTGKDVAPAPLVRKGAVVEVVAGEGGMSISMKGLAMATGVMGDVITVRNMDSRKDFQARVVKRDSVRVTF